MIGVVLSLVMALSATAGSAIAVTTCKSASGRTALEILNQDRFQFLSVKFTIDGESKSFTVDTSDGVGEIDSDGANVDKLSDKVFTVSARSEKDNNFREITLWALPATVQKVSSGDSTQYRFKANVSGTDPRKAKDGALAPLIEVNCELDYSI